MGQQQTVAKKASGALRRIVLALTIAAVMALMMALALADSAQAKSHWRVDETPSGNILSSSHSQKDPGDGPADGGGANVHHVVSGGLLNHDVTTPSGNDNSQTHQNAQK